MKKLFAVIFLFSSLVLVGFGEELSLAAFKQGLTNFEQELTKRSKIIGQKLTNIGQYQPLTLNSAKIVSRGGKTYIFGSVENKAKYTIIGGYLRLVFVNLEKDESSTPTIVYITPFVLRNGQKGYFCANVEGEYDAFTYTTTYATSLLNSFVSTVYDFPYKISRVVTNPISHSKDKIVTFTLSYTNTEDDTLTGISVTIFGLNNKDELSYVGQDIHYWNEVAPKETLTATVTGMENSETSSYGVIIQGMRTFK